MAKAGGVKVPEVDEMDSGIRVTLERKILKNFWHFGHLCLIL